MLCYLGGGCLARAQMGLKGADPLGAAAGCLEALGPLTSQAAGFPLKGEVSGMQHSPQAEVR